MCDIIDARLDNWYKDGLYNILWGDIYNDVNRRWPDGTRIHTSSIKGLHKMNLKEGDTVTTLNSKYLLGKPLTIG